MKIIGLFNAFSVFTCKNENNDSIQEDRLYCLNENNREEFTNENIKNFLTLIDDETIQQFLAFDRCCKLADNYLLAVVFTYFIRAKLPLTEYNRMTFFVALYLAHDLEEDDEDLKCHIMRWGLGRTRVNEIEYFLDLRDNLWKAMDFRASVSLQCCQQVIKNMPNCPLWLRSRSPAHAGASRTYLPAEKCLNCQIECFQFYSSSCESDDSDLESSDEEEFHPMKKLKLSEE